MVALSGITAALGLQVNDPRPGHEGEIFAVQSLMTGDGVRWISQNLVTNFTGFVPLGTVLVAILGVGVAERSGLLTTAVRALVLGAPKNLVTLVIVFAGIISNTASEMGYVVLIPLSMAIFHSLGRHPLCGDGGVVRGGLRRLLGQPADRHRRPVARRHHRGSGADHRSVLRGPPRRSTGTS